MRKALGLLIFGLLSLNVRGQTIESNLVEDEVNLGVISVIGEKEPQNGLIDAPVKVEILDDNYFESQQYQDLAQGVSDIPGVSTTNTSRRAGSKSALIQGFGENSVLVMIDGVPVSQNSSFGFDLSQISVSDLEKVEVIKGGASALYGSQAMGGVINIVTKRPQKKLKANLDLSTSQATSGDSATANNVQFTSSGSFKKWGSKVSFSFREQDSFDLDPSTIGQEGVAFEKLHGSFYLERRLGTLTAFTNYILLKGETTAQSSRPYSSSAFGPSVNITDTTTHNLKAGLEGKLGPGELRALLNVERTEDDLTLNDKPSTDFKETFKQTNFEARRVDLIYKNIKFAGQNLTMGLLFKEDEVNQETTTQAVEQIIVKTVDIDQKKIRSYEAYVQDSFFLGNFEIAPGVRYQYDDNFGSFAAPKVNISHYGNVGAVDLKSWFTIGTGFRAPSVKERFFTLDHTSVANYVVVGNENLEPEESVSVQLGEEVRYKGMTLHGNLFLNRVNNLIDTVERDTGTSSRLFTYDNFSEVISRGIETGLKLNITDNLSSRLNYTYSETINQETNLLLANRPLHSGLISLDYRPTLRWNLRALGRFTGAKYIDNENLETSPEFATLDLRASYQWSKSLLLYGSINNVLDVTRDPIEDTVVPVVDDRPSLGRQIFVGLKMEVL